MTGIGFLPDSSMLVALWSGNYNDGATLIQVNPNDLSVMREVEISSNAYFNYVITESDSSIRLFGNEPEIYGNNGIQQSGLTVVEMNTIQESQNETNYGGDQGDAMRSVIRTSDGRYAIVGFTRSFGAGGSDATLIFY